MTGESRPVERTAGATLVAGTVVVGSSAHIWVSAVGDATRLAGLGRLVAEAESSRSRTQALADRAAGLLFYIAAGAAALTFLVWLLFVRDAGAAVTRAVTVLVISCPHALGLAIPLVIALATWLAARQGILVRDRLSLERMRVVDTVLFDKTGTLTPGRARREGRRRARRRRGPPARARGRGGAGLRASRGARDPLGSD